MILNGKAKEDCIQWVKWNYNYLEYKFDLFDNTYRNALIIEWFDSVGVYISINYVNFVNELTSTKGFEAMITNKHLTTRFRETKTRKKATEQALEKANEIYNNQK